MRYSHLENADVDVSQIAVGTWAMGGDSFGDNNDISSSVRAIQTMLERGVNLIDTAPCYGNGTAEKIVGRALMGIDREKYLLSTKVGLITSSSGYDRDSSFKNIIREVESSLRNLRTDYLDFYFVHWPDPKTSFAETMSALRLLKEQGKIRHIGVSNFTKEMIEECEKYADVDVQQPPFSMVNREYEPLIKWGVEKGIDSFTYGSLGAGILSGKYRELPTFSPGDVRGTFYDYFREPKFSKIQELLKVMDGIAATHNVSLSEVAINWSTQKPYVATALVGVRSPRHAEENCAALDWELSKDEMALLDNTLDTLEIG